MTSRNLQKLRYTNFEKNRSTPITLCFKLKKSIKPLQELTALCQKHFPSQIELELYDSCLMADVIQLLSDLLKTSSLSTLRLNNCYLEINKMNLLYSGFSQNQSINLFEIRSKNFCEHEDSTNIVIEMATIFCAKKNKIVDFGSYKLNAIFKAYMQDFLQALVESRVPFNRTTTMIEESHLVKEIIDYRHGTKLNMQEKEFIKIAPDSEVAQELKEEYIKLYKSQNNLFYFFREAIKNVQPKDKNIPFLDANFYFK